MAEEKNNSEVKEIDNSFDTSPPAISEEGSVETLLAKDVGNAQDVTSKGQEEINQVPKPQSVTLRRYSTGVVGTRAGKPQVQSRYRGNYQGSSIHDFCKHGVGKKCHHADAVKPWKTVARKSVEGSETVKAESSSLRRKSLSNGVVIKTESSVAAKRDVLAVKKKPSASVNSESSGVSETARSVDGSSVKSNEKALKTKETESTLSSGSAVVKKVSAMKKVSKTNDAESAKACAPKNLKNKEKAKTEATSGEDVKEKTVCVVESSIKTVQSEKKLRVTTPKQISPAASIDTGLTKKKESVSTDFEANPKPERKVRPKKTGVKVPLAKQLSFKRGKTLEPKPQDLSPRWTRFRKRVVLEQKAQTEGRKKNLKSVDQTKKDSCEGSSREKVVLRHQKVEGKKKMMTLLNNVIEETVTKLTKVRKHKVKALIGAFETVISLQDSKPSEKAPRASASNKVSPLVSKQ